MKVLNVYSHILVIEEKKLPPRPVTCPINSIYPNHGAFKLHCTGTVNDDSVMDLLVEPAINDANVTQYSQFWYLFAALALSWVGMAVIVSVGDAICFDLLGKRHDLYGQQRCWGAVGWGIFTLIAGFLVDTISGTQSNKNYSVIYYLMMAALLPNIFVSTCLEVRAHLVQLFFFLSVPEF